jgi:hypothetical protein
VRVRQTVRRVDADDLHEPMVAFSAPPSC